MAKLVLSLLGGFSVLLDETPVFAFESDKVRALLSYLAIESDQAHRRETLAGLFWPDTSEQLARHSLSQSLYNLQRITNNRNGQQPFLRINQQDVQFNLASDHHLDARSFGTLAKAHRQHRHLSLQNCQACLENLHKAVELYEGELLKGFSLSDSAPFEEWLLLSRERHNRIYTDLLQHLVEAYSAEQKYEHAIPYCQRWVDIDPYEEDAHYWLIEMLIKIGRRNDAIAHFDKCSAILWDALGFKPSQKLVTLTEQIRAGVITTVESSHPILAPQLIQITLGKNSAHSWLPIRHRSSEPLPLLARDSELRQLTDSLNETLSGEGQVIFVTGEAGRGKTALVQAFCRQVQAQHEDLIVVGGSCNAHTGVGVSYAAFRDIMTMLTNDSESAYQQTTDSDMQAARLLDLFPSVVQAILEVGPALLDAIVPAVPLLKHVEKVLDCNRWMKQTHSLFEQRYAMAQTLGSHPSLLCTHYMNVLEWLARRHPILLVLDHLQWADVDTIDMLSYIGMHIKNSRIMIIGCYRPSELTISHTQAAQADHHPLFPVIDEFSHLFGTLEIALERDSDPKFVNAYLGRWPNRLDGDFRQMLDCQTAGNPLFVHELMQHMVANRQLTQDADGYWVATPCQEWHAMPKRIEAIIAEQIRRLPAHLHNLLAVASAEGDCFTVEVLAHVLSLNQQVLVQQLSGILTHQYRLICALGVGYEGARRVCRYRFRQSIVRHYLYEQLDKVQRPLLHEAINKAVEEVFNPS